MGVFVYVKKNNVRFQKKKIHYKVGVFHVRKKSSLNKFLFSVIKFRNDNGRGQFFGWKQLLFLRIKFENALRMQTIDKSSYWRLSYERLLLNR